MLHSLRGRLSALLLVMLLPTVAAFGVDYLHQRAALMNQSRAEAARIVRLARNREAAVLDRVRALLALLADRREAADFSDPECRKTLSAVVRGQPLYDNLGYVDAKGALRCSAVADAAADSFADSRWFREVRDRRRFSVGSVASPGSGNFKVAYGYPVGDRGDSFLGAVFAVTRLTWLADLIAIAELPAGTIADVVNARGEVVERYASPVKALDQRPQWLHRLQSCADAASFTGTDNDGVQRTYACAPLHVDGGTLYLLVGMPAPGLETVVNTMFMRNLLWLGVLAAVTAGLAWFGVERLFVRQVDELVTLTRQVGEGDFSPREGHAGGIRELDRLAVAFNAMAGELAGQARDRERAYGALRESEARYRELVERSPDAIFVHVDGVVVYANPAMATMLRASSAAPLVGIDVLQFVAPEFAGVVRQRIASQMRGETVEAMEQQYICRDGATVDVEVISTPQNYLGAPAVQVIARDISARKHAERELRRSEASLARAQRIANLGSWELDLLENRLYWSNQIYHMFGVDKAQFGGTYEDFLERVHPDDRARVDAAQRAALAQHRPLEIEHRIVLPDGSIRIVDERGRVEYDAAGVPVRLTGTVLDISERRRVQSALEDANRRLTALSRRVLEIREAEQRALARELHDEIGQALTAININAQALDRIGVDERARSRLHELQTLARDALAKVRGVSLDLRPPQLDDFGLEATIRWNATRQAEGAALMLHLDLALGDRRYDAVIESNGYRICQEAMTNVVRHAQAANVWVRATEAGDRLLLEVRDDGIGFDSADKRRQSEGGDSFGLFGMEERATLCGGRVEIQSHKGGGTVVRAWLPLSVAPTNAAEVQA